MGFFNDFMDVVGGIWDAAISEQEKKMEFRAELVRKADDINQFIGTGIQKGYITRKEAIDLIENPSKTPGSNNIYAKLKFYTLTDAKEFLHSEGWLESYANNQIFKRNGRMCKIIEKKDGTFTRYYTLYQF